LANLGVGREGCDIVFDSTENLDQDEAAEKKKTNGSNGMVDITSLAAKLDANLSLFELSLVPQLAGLRAEYSQLDEDGFVETDALTSTSARSRRFAPEPEEENEADRSIHQEAMERSAHRASQAHSFTRNDGEDDAGKTPLSQGGGGDDDDDYAADDYGGGYNDDDDDDDHAFVNFMVTDTNASRFSSASFTGSVSQQQQFDASLQQANSASASPSMSTLTRHKSMTMLGPVPLTGNVPPWQPRAKLPPRRVVASHHGPSQRRKSRQPRRKRELLLQPTKLVAAIVSLSICCNHLPT
jgi:hypothetical protein